MLLEYHKPNSTNRSHNIEYIIVWSHKCWENNYWKNFGERTSVIAITPMSFSQYFKDFLNLDNVLAIELIDSAENLFDRLVFSDENDVIYKDDVYKNEHKEYYLDEFEADLEWYGFVYKDIKNKFNVNAMPPDKATSKLIKRFHLLPKKA